ncbi:hypothetical protein [Nitrosomonas ureae]|uniref:Uncharacterized protein n=1 Tax=Nitrosomonas ureae TaxID=44577 RepID=A0A2T5I8I4_9PROT|nr:hypothetical protein [Nitrosomonas ureae]PTQ80114.1 hypothetical protein C8R28_10411 [Nitrosomonas ureae]
MDTIRVDICYRPLRIGWIIHSGDYEAFRKAVRLSHTLWGGSFNPILMADREDEAKLLIELFRIDMLWPIGESNEVKEFPKKFPHLINPLFHDSIFIGGNIEQKRNQVLDVQNALEYLRDKPARKAINDKGFRIYNWQVDDPLADIFHIQLGIYPETAVIGIDYREILSQVFEIKEISIDPSSQIPADIQDYPRVC